MTISIFLLYSTLALLHSLTLFITAGANDNRISPTQDEVTTRDYYQDRNSIYRNPYRTHMNPDRWEKNHARGMKSETRAVTETKGAVEARKIISDRLNPLIRYRTRRLL